MVKTFIDACNIVSPLGFDTNENFKKILEGVTGIRISDDPSFSANPLPLAVTDIDAVNVEFSKIGDPAAFTRFEKTAILSVNDALTRTSLETEKKNTLFILSTTKGNIELLEEKYTGVFPSERLKLHNTATVISDFFGFESKPVVVSNACISGVASMVIAKRLIEQGMYDNVVINGTDVVSRFIVSGFQSFLSLSSEPCKPYDGSRDGLTLGEGSATITLTNKERDIEITGGAISNDANHISGPSRTGEGLLIAINNSVTQDTAVDFISAHGTATRYNDDMESIALTRAGLNKVPVNSLKGYYGHTLGAAGIIESVISVEAMRNNTLIKTFGCENPGVVEEINVVRETKKQEIKTMLKLASGFGGGNAAVLFEKNE